MNRAFLILSIPALIFAGLSCKEDASENPVDSGQSSGSPSELKITQASDTAFALQWVIKNVSSNTPIASAVTMIERSTDGTTFTLVDSVNVAVNSRSVAGPYRVGTTYSFRLRSRSAGNYTAYSNTSGMTLEFPAPSDLIETRTTATSVGLQWRDNSSFETGFLIERSTDGINFILVDSAAANATTESVTGVYTPGTTYSFRVRAKSTYSLSGYSNVSSGPTRVGDPSMVLVEGSTYLMGGTGGAPDEVPIHPVTLASFYIDKTEITFEKWTEVRNWAMAHGYDDLPEGSNGYNPIGTNNPVTDVDWYDIVKWCNARSEEDKLKPVYYADSTFSTVYRTGQIDLAIEAVNWIANGYRLPTEAEWEFAALGGILTQDFKYSGSNNVEDVAWYYNNSGVSTHPVSTKRANELGIFDMSGNVWEWCWDWYGTYSDSPQTDPKGLPSGTFRVLRGGSFTYTAAGCRLKNRDLNFPTHRNVVIGFRCAQE